MSASASPLPNVTDIIYPELIGSQLNFFLYGVLVVQVYIYRLSFPGDNTLIKLLVYLVLVFETVQTCLDATDMFHYFGPGFGNFLGLQNPRLSPIHTPIMGATMSLIVQLFFCYRIWIIKKSVLWWCFVIGSVSCLQAISGFVGGVKAYVQQDVAKRFDQKVLVYIWLIGDAVADIMIAATMTFLLMRGSRRHLRRTNDVIMRIVRLTVETNTVASSIAVLSLILYVGAPNTLYFTCPTLLLGKIYANTLLVTFNNRAFVHRGQRQTNYSGGNVYLDSSVVRGPTTSLRRIPFSAGLKFSDSSNTDDSMGDDISTIPLDGTVNNISLHRLEASGSHSDAHKSMSL